MAVSDRERELIEEIGVLKYKLKQAESRAGSNRGVKHSDRCMIEMDPDYYGPCTCGATQGRRKDDWEWEPS